jgi:Ca2+-binding EF-hand superfamily protein
MTNKPANNFDAQASTNYKEAFSLFDKRGNGRVTRDSLGDLLRACGQNPTLAEIRDLEQNVGGDCTCLVVFSPGPRLVSFLHTHHFFMSNRSIYDGQIG